MLLQVSCNVLQVELVFISSRFSYTNHGVVDFKESAQFLHFTIPELKPLRTEHDYRAYRRNGKSQGKGEVTSSSNKLIGSSVG